MVTPNKKKKNILATVISHIATVEYEEWPPKCATFLYQPSYPKALKHDEEMDMQNREDSAD